eukprot:COSAG02_NODE_60988_length_269_cov_7.235294_1_plen_40_part_10
MFPARARACAVMHTRLHRRSEELVDIGAGQGSDTSNPGIE